MKSPHPGVWYSSACFDSRNRTFGIHDGDDDGDRDDINITDGENLSEK
jgi:hypothetical protein